MEHRAAAPCSSPLTAVSPRAGEQQRQGQPQRAMGTTHLLSALGAQSSEPPSCCPRGAFIAWSISTLQPGSHVRWADCFNRGRASRQAICISAARVLRGCNQWNSSAAAPWVSKSLCRGHRPGTQHTCVLPVLFVGGFLLQLSLQFACGAAASELRHPALCCEQLSFLTALPSRSLSPPARLSHFAVLLFAPWGFHLPELTELHSMQL